MDFPLIPVILCSGSGPRLWPLSRDAYPKQFLRLLGQESLLQQTMQRRKKIDKIGPPLLVCNESSRFIAAEQIREIGLNNVQIVLEPMRRNTAPAVASAALHAIAQGNDPILMVFPSAPVKPGAKLSLQMHHHRAEHWVVVTGTAKITNGEQEYLLTENQSTYIPVGVVHSLENAGKIPLDLIEIQSGAYLAEDDIVRLQDRYSRA